MAKTFAQMKEEARKEVPVISPEEAHRRLQENPNTLVVDVRDAQEIAAAGMIKGARNVSLGTLPLKADTELPEQTRDPELQDRSRPIITTCGVGGQASLAAKTLKDMGFTNVSILDTGTKGWQDAGLPMEEAGGSRS